MTLPFKNKEVLRGAQVCWALHFIALDFNAAAWKTNISLLVFENKFTQ